MRAQTRASGLAMLLLAGTAGGAAHTAANPWVRVFDQVDHDGLFGALPLDDGRAIVVGATGYTHVPPYRGDALIMFVDLADGSVIHERTWGGDGFDQAWDVARAPGAGFYVFGETDSWGAGDRDFFLLKLDARGEPEWFRTYGTPKREWPFGMLALANGDLLLYGRTESETGDEDPYAVRVGPTGEVVWTYVDRAPEPAIVLDAVETPAGDVVLATSVGEDPGLTFLGRDGEVRGTRRFEIPGWQYASGIEPTDDGYLLAGFSMTGGAGGKADVWLAGVSADGALLWQKSFGDEASDDYATTLLRLSDGSYVIGGMGPGLPLWTVDASGRVLGHRRVAGEGVYAAFGLVELPDRSLLVPGVQAVVSPRSFDAVLARTAANGAPETPADLERTAGATVPMTLDHDRVLVDGTVQRGDGSWRSARLWVDTGNPDLFLSERLARDLGVDLRDAPTAVEGGRLEVPVPAGLRLGGMTLDLEGVRAWVVFEPTWLFSTTHADANLPSTVLRRYQVVFDYPGLQLTVAPPGRLPHRGVAAPALVRAETGVAQLAAIIEQDTFSFALDAGASYSFTSERVLRRLRRAHPAWPTHVGALGAANMWGWWPREETWPVLRVPEIRWGGVPLAQVGLVGLGEVFGPGFDLGTWYSQKTARPVDGFLGPNAFGGYRVEIDYANDTVYFERGPAPPPPDMDLVGLTLRPESDGSYSVLGVAEVDGTSAVPGVQPGDRLVGVDGWDIRGATMGAVVDALRGRPGDLRALVVERDGRRHTVEATVRRFLGPAPAPPLPPRRLPGQVDHHGLG